MHVCTLVGTIVGYIGFNPAVFNEGRNHLALGCETICPFGEVTKEVISTGTSHTHIFRVYGVCQRKVIQYTLTDAHISFIPSAHISSLYGN